MRVAHRHRQRLMTQPHLHTPDIDAAPDEARSTGVTQDVRHDLVVGAKSDLGFRLVQMAPNCAWLNLVNGPFGRERPFGGSLITSLTRSVIGMVRLRPDMMVWKLTRCP